MPRPALNCDQLICLVEDDDAIARHAIMEEGGLPPCCAWIGGRVDGYPISESVKEVASVLWSGYV